MVRVVAVHLKVNMIRKILILSYAACNNMKADYIKNRHIYYEKKMGCTDVLISEITENLTDITDKNEL